MPQPYGRYNNGSRFAGETDFFESLVDLKRRFPIDEDRIVIRGFSLGGATAWHLTAHYAADWAASAPRHLQVVCRVHGSPGERWRVDPGTCR